MCKDVFIAAHIPTGGSPAVSWKQLRTCVLQWFRCREVTVAPVYLALGGAGLVLQTNVISMFSTFLRGQNVGKGRSRCLDKTNLPVEPVQQACLVALSWCRLFFTCPRCSHASADGRPHQRSRGHRTVGRGRAGTVNGWRKWKTTGRENLSSRGRWTRGVRPFIWFGSWVAGLWLHAAAGEERSVWNDGLKSRLSAQDCRKQMPFSLHQADNLSTGPMAGFTSSSLPLHMELKTSEATVGCTAQCWFGE